jgi:hypothetical protein
MTCLLKLLAQSFGARISSGTLCSPGIAHILCLDLGPVPKIAQVYADIPKSEKKSEI